MRTVGDLIKGRSFYTADSEHSVYETARYMAEKDIGAVPVLQESRLVGIFSERDIIKRVIVPGKDVRTTLIKDVMTSELVVAQSGEEVSQVLEKMQKNRCRHMPVVMGDRLAGFLSLRDLLSADLEEKDAQVQQLNTYIHYSP
ncbi:MAG TPA: CBS domain-containing protein [Terriglobia bacterium]|nr:CBS domain-containing protein [Terriglobia bacterium]